MYLNETFGENQIGRHFSDTFPKGLEKESSLYHHCFPIVPIWNMPLRDPRKPGEIDETCKLLV
jgi:hypothetical protein